MDKPMNVPVMVQMPAELKAFLFAYADEHNTSVAALLREASANLVGYTLEPTTLGARKKYATVEERKAAQKIRTKELNDLKSQVFKQYLAEQKRKVAEAAANASAS